MDEVMDRADVVVDNTDTLDAYRRRIRAILEGDLDAVADSDYVHVRSDGGDPARGTAADSGSAPPEGGDGP